MIKPQELQTGDKVAIVSLSRGVLGESFAAHELALGEKRLAELGLSYEYMPNAKKGIAYLQEHPEARAEDIKAAFKDDSIKAIICAIGGDDTFTTIPYLVGDDEFVQIVHDNPKIFLGFSDTTINHLMFYKMGLQTYYGPAFLTDFAEFAKEMPPYTKEWAYELLQPSPQKEIVSSLVWYDERESYGSDQIGVERVSHFESHGFEVLRGKGIVEGELLGGCIDSLSEALTGSRYAEEKTIIAQYGIFPSETVWRGKVLFAETSEERPSPEKLRSMLQELDRVGVLSGVAAILVGKPQDEAFYEEYRTEWLKATEPYDTPILYNLNFGHATPRCILPYGAKVQVDFDQAKVVLQEPLTAN